MDISDKEYKAMNDFVDSIDCVDTPMDSFLHEMQQLLIKHNASLKIEVQKVTTSVSVCKFGVVVGQDYLHLENTVSTKFLEEKHFQPQ